jgi:hypothetical protein
VFLLKEQVQGGRDLLQDKGLQPVRTAAVILSAVNVLSASKLGLFFSYGMRLTLDV